MQLNKEAARSDISRHKWHGKLNGLYHEYPNRKKMFVD